MIRRILVGTVALLAGSAIAAAAAKDDVSGAVKKLGDNYSWKSTIENAGGGGGGGGGGRGGGFGGPAEGKTADGYVLMSFSGRNGNTTEILRKGEKVVIKTDNGWKTPEEMQQDNANNNAGGGGRRGRGGPGGMARGARLPAVLADDLATKASGLEKSGDAYSGTLSEDAVKELLSPPRRGGGGGGNAPEISKAKGTVKFWLKDGALSKYEYNVQGTMTMQNGNEREINRTTTVELSEVGSTKIDVPDEAKKKLES